MATAAKKIVVPTADHAAIIREVADKPLIILTDAAKLDLYLDALKAEAEANPGDVSTDTGRGIIRSNAAEIGRKKSGIEKERLRATEEYRTKVNIINAAGKVVKERLQALQDAVRAPLTAWEEREEARKSEAQAIIDDMVSSSVIGVDDTPATVQERLDRIRGRNLSDEMFGPQLEQVVDLRDSTVSTLQAAIERLEQAERDARDLARLREEAEQRAREDAERAAKEEADRKAAEDARVEAAVAERRRIDEAARI